MANVEHSTLTTTNLHENKGVSTAADNTVATAISGATVWSKLTATNLTGTGNSFGGQLLHVRFQGTAGTNGGSSTSGSFQRRPLNTVITNEISGTALTSNQITGLPAGTYFCDGSFITVQSNQSQHKLVDATHTTDLVIGQVNYHPSGQGSNWADLVKGRFILSATSTVEIDYRVTSGFATVGLGQPASWGTEVFADLMIWKIS
jgi:hypothetical protein